MTIATRGRGSSRKAFAAQAAVLDAGDCAMIEALRFTQRRSAQLVRDSLPSADMLALWSALQASS